HSEEEGRAVAAHLLEDRFRRRTAGKEDGAGAHVKGKVLSVAKSVREEELGDRKAAVFGPRAQDLLAIGAAADPGIVLEMNHALGLSGRSARIEKEREAVSMRCRVAGRGRRLGGPLHRLRAFPRCAAVDGDRGSIDDARLEDEQTRIAVGEDCLELLGLEQRVQRNREGPGRARPPERNGEERPIRQNDGDSISAVYPLALERRREAANESVELAECRDSFVRRDRDAVSTSGGSVAPDEPLRGIETVRQLVAG